jgi:hypothetical protein
VAPRQRRAAREQVPHAVEDELAADGPGGGGRRRPQEVPGPATAPRRGRGRLGGWG